MELFLIDAIGPFFCRLPQQRINWSKIPFHTLESNGSLDRSLFRRIRQDFASFADTVRDLGYNALTLDDLAHLFDHPAYPPALRARIGEYREEYRALLTLAHDRGLKVMITSDVLFHHPVLTPHIGSSAARAAAFLRDQLGRLFQDHGDRWRDLPYRRVRRDGCPRRFPQSSPDPDASSGPPVPANPAPVVRGPSAYPDFSHLERRGVPRRGSHVEPGYVSFDLRSDGG
jgi:hypothetical protein